MRSHFTFFVTLYFVCTHTQCNIDSEKGLKNKSGSRTLKSELYMAGNVNGIYVREDYDVLISKNNAVAHNELKGKLCLKDVNKCMQEDSDYERSTARLSSYLFGMMPPFDLSAVDGVSQECQRSSQKFVEDLNMFQFWALQMYDATAKFPSGILSSNVIQLGDFDLCLKSKLEERNIHAQYCLANLQFATPSSPYLSALHNLIHAHGVFKSNLVDPGHRVPRFSSVQWGLCTPDTCTAQDVEVGLRAALQAVLNSTEIEYDVNVDSEMCQTAKTKPWPTSTYFGIGFFAAVIALELLATLYDYMKSEERNELVLAFSLRKNLAAVTSAKKDQNNIDAVHVIRFINALMLLISHKSMAILFLPFINRVELGANLGQAWTVLGISACLYTDIFIMISGAPNRWRHNLGQAWTVLGRSACLYTDIFIMISGTLTAYSLFGQLRKKNTINIPQEYLSRILRILPTFSALILFCTLVLPWLNAGPMWNQVITHHSDICKKYWWRNVFFIHNYFGFTDMCLTHTHHVGIDTQLFFMSPFMVLLVWKWPKRGTLTLLGIAVVSTVMRFYVTYNRNLSIYVHFGASTEQLFNTADYMYILPPYRLTVYIMGILLGYMLRNHKNVNFKPAMIHAGNIIALVCFCSAFFGPAFMADINYVYNPKDAAWYAAFAPILWCWAFGWVIYITHIGYRGYINAILSHPLPKFWTNISYTVYLTQFPIFFYNVGTTRHADYYGVITKHANVFEMWWIITLSMTLSVLFELPSQHIRNILFKTRSTAMTGDGDGEKVKAA